MPPSLLHRFPHPIAPVRPSLCDRGCRLIAHHQPPAAAVPFRSPNQPHRFLRLTPAAVLVKDALSTPIAVIGAYALICLPTFPPKDKARPRKLGKKSDSKRKLGECLTEALKLVALIGLIFIAFGPSYSYSLLRLLYGRKWSDGEAPKVLRYYCIYILLVAMNGTSEAFLHAVADESQIKRSNDSLLVFSSVYIVLNVLVIRSAGAVGLIIANSLNMLLRITYSLSFIQSYFQDSSFSLIHRCIPSGSSVLLLSGFVTLISEKLLLDKEKFWPTFLIHLSVGLSCFCISLLVICLFKMALRTPRASRK